MPARGAKYVKYVYTKKNTANTYTNLVLPVCLMSGCFFGKRLGQGRVSSPLFAHCCRVEGFGVRDYRGTSLIRDTHRPRITIGP